MNKHKHYQSIRAYADGWGIEIYVPDIHSITDYETNVWKYTHNPSFLAGNDYRIVPDAEGWLPWYGGECPVPDKTVVVRRKGDNQPQSIGMARHTDWNFEGQYKVFTEESKPKKVKMWQWVVKEGIDAPTLTTYFYPSEDQVKKQGNLTIIQRADWTEIEVEK